MLTLLLRLQLLLMQMLVLMLLLLLLLLLPRTDCHQENEHHDQHIHGNDVFWEVGAFAVPPSDTCDRAHIEILEAQGCIERPRIHSHHGTMSISHQITDDNNSAARSDHLGRLGRLGRP